MFEYIFIFILALCFGSFLNVLIQRLPKGLSIVTPRSFCFACKTPIPWYQNIPLVSFVVLKGKCYSCKHSISFSYFIVEAISACITILIYEKLGLTVSFLFVTALFYFLIVLAFIDIKYKAVPDYLLLIVLVLVFFATSFELIEALKNAFIFVGAFALLEFCVTFYIQNIKAVYLKDNSLRNQKALGEGDIPIIAVVAGLLGLEAGLIAIFLSAFFAVIVTIFLQNKNLEIPFIPYLLLGLGIEYFFTISKVIL